ncbi:MAG: diguanylate cyclase [Candidatus Kapabacteria bacterium]|nr:diguanylate cyclase [Candidatus Kapabacteria bacterium]
MKINEWADGVDFAITICDSTGIITFMNDKSVDIFSDDGGRNLIGQNLLDCHPEPSRSHLDNMLKIPFRNVYTIEKNGKKKIIYQEPIYIDARFVGIAELSMEIPFDMPHFIRKS